jgi:hypothetical protein
LVSRNPGVVGAVDGRLDSRQAGTAAGFVALDWRGERVGIPGVAGGLRGEQREALVVELQAGLCDASGRRAAAVQQDCGPRGVGEVSPGGDELLVAVWVVLIAVWIAH